MIIVIKKYIYLVIVIFIFVLILVSYNKILSKDVGIAENIYHNSLHSDQLFFDNAYEKGSLIVKPAQQYVYGGIIPHHLMVKQNIAAFWLGIEDNNYDTIILIGPDHFDKNSTNIVTSKAFWLTPYGEISPDNELIDFLVDNKIVTVDEYPFYGEHSITGLVSFIKRSQPQVKIVPLVVNRRTRKDQSIELAGLLNQYSQQNKILVIASVDFSHDFPTVIADEHDKISNQAILSFDFNSIYDLDLDSPVSIYTLLAYLKLKGTVVGDLLFSTNSGRLINQMDMPTTSHNIFYFY